MKLRTNLFLLVLGTVLPFMVLAALLMTLLVQYERESIRRAATDRIRAFMTAVDSELRGTVGALQVLAASEDLKTGDFRAFRREALNVLDTQPDWLFISVRRPTGEPVLDTARSAGAALTAAVDPTTVKQAIETRKVIIGNVFSRNGGKESAIAVRLPLLIEGDIRYVVTAGIRTDPFQRLIRAQQLQQGWTIALVDSTGRFIARDPPTASAIASRDFMQALNSPEGWYRGHTVEGLDTFTAHFTSTLSGWSAGQAIPVEQIDGQAIRAGGMLSAGILGVTALAFGFAYWMSRRITTTVSALVSSARSLGGTSAKEALAGGVTERASGASSAGSKVEEVRALEQALSESARKLRSQLIERDRAEEALRKSERRFRALTTASSDVLYCMSPDWSEMRQLSGEGFLAQADTPTRAWQEEYIPHSDRPRMMHAIDEAIRSRSIFELEHRVRRADGSIGWMVSRAIPILAENGEIIEWFGAASDITDRKRAEHALRATMQRVDSALENSPLAVIEWSSEDFRLARWSGEAVRIFGWTAEEVMGRRIDELALVYEEDWPAVREVMADMLSGKRPRNVSKNRNVRKDGAVILCEWYNSTVADSGGNLRAVLSLVLEVTDRKRAEEALQRRGDELETARAIAESARMDAEVASHAKDHFLAVLSHELRTPLTPVLAAVDLLQRRPDLNADAREPLEIIRRNVWLQAHLIDDLLDLTRIAQGKLELKREPIDVCNLIERAVEIAKPDIDAGELSLGVTLKNAPHLVNGDASRLQQVIWNLLTNAVKFTPKGGCVGLRCERLDGHVMIEVSDSGIGIEPEAAEKIFDAFEQGGRAITRQFGGLGLGLAIAKRLVEMHDGSISVHSAGRNQGSTFRVRLPLSTVPPQGQDPKPAPPAQVHAKRILLVEDNADSAMMMKLLLETYGYEVESAGDVAQALTAIESTHFDLLISDLGLPDRTGVELLQELRRRGHALKAIALSGYGQPEDMRRSNNAGFSVHLTKPIDSNTLAEVVSSLL